MRTIPVDLILHSLALDLREHPEDDHEILSSAIAVHCIDHRVVADTWTHGAGVAQSSDWLMRRIDPTRSGIGEHVSAETRAMEVAVARRFADVGLALLVTQDAEDRTAASLLLDAARLVVGLERTQAVNGKQQRHDLHCAEVRRDALQTRIEELTQARDAALRDIIRARDEADVLRAECVDLKRRHDERTARLQSIIDEALDSARQETVWVPPSDIPASPPVTFNDMATVTAMDHPKFQLGADVLHLGMPGVYAGRVIGSAVNLVAVDFPDLHVSRSRRVVPASEVTPA